MSVIHFTCEPERREELKTGVWAIVREHYLTTVYPHMMDSKNGEKKESEEIYIERLNELMKTNLCVVNETEEGLDFEFDSTEDAGFFIADDVYQTGPRYMVQEPTT